MTVLDSLVHALQEDTIAKRVAIPHDEARMRYRLNSNTVPSWRDFENAIGEYYAYHYSACVVAGGRLSREEAAGRAKEQIEHGYRRRRGDIATAYADARDGTNGGLRAILDLLADGMKEESVMRYVRHQFDTHVEPVDFDAKVAIVREFFREFGRQLPNSVDLNRPERYAHNYQELVNGLVQGLRESSAIFRRL